MGERRNVSGTAYALTVFTAILPGLEEEARASIERLGMGPESPFARLSTVHTARLLVLDHLVHQGPSQEPDQLRSGYLVFTATFDGELDPFLEALARLLPAEADSWWRHCVGYPGVSNPSAFRIWIRHHQVHTSLFAIASPNRSVAEVLEGLTLRERILEFAIAAQGLDAAELQSRFRRTFAEVH